MASQDSISISNIDKAKLINAVHKRPVLWNKYAEVYNDRTLKSKAWEEICRILKKDYEQMNEEDQEEFNRNVVRAWQRTRDTWVRNFIDRRRKPYRYHDQMLFLKDVINSKDFHEIFEEFHGETGDTESVTIKDDPNSDNESDSDEDEKPIKIKTSEMAELQNKEDKRKTPNIIEVMIPDVPKTETPNESRHMAFFRSIQPTLSLFNDDQCLQFQAGVIDLCQRIKRQRNQQDFNQPETSTRQVDERKALE